MKKNPPELKDFKTWHVKEPFEDYAGPFFYKKEPDGRNLAAFQCKKQHLNSIDTLHGGMIMAFADYALFVIGHEYTSLENYVTISCNTEFLRGSTPEGIVYANGEVTRSSKTMLFIKGKIFYQDLILATFSGILKKV